MSKYMLLLGTSNTRQYSVTGKKKGSLYHSGSHNCCLVEDQALIQGDTRVADYPGLSTRSWLTQKCQNEVFYDMKPWEVITNSCQDPEFSGIIATIFLCNDINLVTSYNGGIEAVRTYFYRLSQLFSRVTNFEKIQMVILTPSLFRQQDFVDVTSLEKKQNFNANLLSSINESGCQIRVNGTVIKHSFLDFNSVFDTSEMAEDKFYCHLEIYPRWGRNSAIHLNKIYAQQILGEFHRIKAQISKSLRRKRRGGRNR